MDINATILGQAIAFIVFVGFCMKYVWPPLMTAITQRQKEVSDAFTAVEHAKKDLELSKLNVVNQIQTAKNNARIILEEAYENRAQLLNEAKDSAMQERKKILTEAQAIIHKERQRMREELRQQVTELIMSGVQQIIERSLDEAEHGNIVKKIIDELS
ncbi:F0F1 ATP synthase subunit B [Candidatus Erwinia haradaeae]|uniref:ATP synthase subunit b n=1 Tax=Candidatus Erwinia haradaeae TaxID=1922217 RepID=A0A451D7F8_9GAMM|nr:F0F1 ATP synthase subunit B [Candidatus Erwinia haradaeae]VFP81703.1 ATP synthase subunit b [Candidatus Erwinia haradaeae]